MLDAFSKEFKLMDVFNESSYSKSFDYQSLKATLSQLNFCHLVDRKTFHQFTKQIGFHDHGMMEEEFAEVAPGGPLTLTNSELVDFPATAKLGYRSDNPSFDFLNYVTKLELDDSDVVYLNSRVFQFMKKMHPKVNDLRRVIYKTGQGLKAEINLPVVRILYIDNAAIKDKKMSISNIKSFVKTIQISKFLNQSDLLVLLKELAVRAFGTFSNSINNCQILLPDDDDLDYISAHKVLTGQASLQLINENDNLSNYNIYHDKLIIFVHKKLVDDWTINFIPQTDSSNPIVLPAKINTRLCSKCGKMTSRDSSMRRICVCGKIYCDYVCKHNDTRHACETKSCAYCQRALKTDIAICDCGELYCDSDCQDNARKEHSKICNYATTANKFSSNGFYSSYFRKDSVDEELTEGENGGKIGLSNIGNTCYMNSALQVAMHTDLLKQFFMNYAFVDEINEGNVFGTKGILLQEIGELFKSYYKTKGSKITPYRFKSLVAKFNTTFEGYSQHDSQEFWSYLLDSIHEDTNRILTKPYVENLQAKPTDNDLEVARKSWVNHLKRNYSIITENFTGQFKSTVECPICSLTSITFDPYNLISLSIPIIAQHEFDFYFINADQTGKAMKYTFLSKSLHNFNDISLNEVTQKFATVLKMSADKLRFGIFGFSFIGDVCRSTDALSRLMEAKTFSTKPKIFLTELNENDSQVLSKPNSVLVLFKTNWEVYDSETKLSKYSFEYSKLARDYSEDPIFTKMFYISTESTVRELYVCVLRKFFHVSNLTDPKKDQPSKPQIFYHSIWDAIETQQKDRRFFYIKQGTKLLSGAILDKKIGEVCELIDGKIIINVFIRTKANTSVIVDLDKLVSCSVALNSKENEVTCVSEDLADYKKEYSLNYLLENFSQSEILDAENTWYCNTCKEHVQARKTIQVYKLPNYLVFHLKKLKYQAKHIPLITFPTDEINMESYVMNKEKTRNYKIAAEEICSEKDLEIFRIKNREFLIPEPKDMGNGLKYKLYGVVNHFGSQHFGHYTAFAELDSGQWAEFNDSSVSQMSKKDIVSEGAYILFYKRI